MKKINKYFAFMFVLLVIFFASNFTNNNVVWAADKININTADALGLDAIPEVGPSTAAKIIAYRVANGPFSVIEDIMKVSGIKQATFDKMKDFITVDSGSGTDTGGGTATTTEENATTTATSTATSTATTTVSDNNIITTIYSVHYIEEDLSDYVEPTTFEVSAGRGRLSYVNSPVIFVAKSKMSNGIFSGNCQYDWNFGDGVSLTGEKVLHIYKYPGDYNAVLNGSCAGLQSVSRTAVKILAPNLSISVKDSGAVEIRNNGGNEISLYGWNLSSANFSYAFPQDTIISAGKAVDFPVEYLKIPTAGNGIVLTDASAKVIAEAGLTSLPLAANSDNGKIMSIADFQKFALAYMDLPNRQPATLTLSTAPNPSSSDEGRRDVIASSSEPEIPLTAAVVETSSGGFWSKLFHPIRTIQEVFYK